MLEVGRAEISKEPQEELIAVRWGTKEGEVNLVSSLMSSSSLASFATT